ncbi:MAG TPA: ATP-binding protein, partial [Thermomicrobiales bacterium]|nr:ATP-binding protein [Thermomicrobiales bacterium]
MDRHHSAARDFDWLQSSGEMVERIRAFEWSKTSIGPANSWSPALRMLVRFLVANRFPHILWWGADYVQFYNDPYRPIPGSKHPAALGQPARECWAEIWDVIGPLIDTPFLGGPATWDDDIVLEINRRGFPEETHFTIAYSPVPDDTVPGGIGGVLATVHEITEKVLGERRITVLRDLGARVGEARTPEEAYRIAAQTLEAHSKDVPFALFYLLNGDRTRLHLAGATGVTPGLDISPETASAKDASDMEWPLNHALASGKLEVVAPLRDRFVNVPVGPWSEPPTTAVAMSIPSNKANEPAGVLVAGISARLTLDASYRDFLELVRTQVATAVNNARAYDEERKRAEALAELDRAKTAFFSNVSHEFRTPLTLMLGPLEDVLADQSKVNAAQREQLAIAHRNALRLLKLVNTVLDFSRLEAGRLHASYQPTDLAALTTELASVFRAATEREGLRLVVDCPPLAQPVYVDREMWEKIVLNLLSNAFKFTFEGEIEVSLRQVGANVELSVRDTGTGIAASDLPHIFERFHRIPGARGRTVEGSGIGLTLVQELVRLHGGRVDVTSELDSGTRFCVSVPLGTGHLPADRIGATWATASTVLDGNVYVAEASGWTDVAAPPPTVVDRISERQAPGGRARILLVDDNADLRAYVSRLLEQRYDVAAFGDGHSALTAARNTPPDLVLTDVMMPGLDGSQLLSAIRADEYLKSVPVILLSARAGEEARIEGLTFGADDYVVKPFAARELLARVESLLTLARMRRDIQAALERSEERFRALTEASFDIVYRMSADWTEMRYLRGREFIADTLEPSQTWLERYIPSGDQPAVLAAITRAIEGKTTFELEHRVIRTDGRLGWTHSRAIPTLDARGDIVEWFGAASDVTARKHAEEALGASEQRLRTIIEQLPAGVGVMDKTGAWVLTNSLMDLYVPRAIPSTLPDRHTRWRAWDEQGNPLPPERWPGKRALAGETVMPGLEMLYTHDDGRELWMRVSTAPLRNEAAEIVGASC